MTTVGERFARALAAKDFDAVRETLTLDLDFRGLTPRAFWEASSPDALIDDVLTVWFNDDDHIDEIVSIETGTVGDRERVAWRFHGHNGDGPYVVEQQAYYEERDGRIAWLRILCAGMRPLATL
jgi:hypothetical protein